CNCDILEGDMAWCEIGDLYCPDGETLAHCDDGVDFTFTACSERCVEALGEGAVSNGCDAVDPADPCNCVIPE
ncbi:hypothetical protein KJ865_17250, partial [Myxococcota bacterium]|nr:hypothetical protein [Myxococcota bacterium]